MVGWPVVGRDEELRFVVEALRGERTRGVVLAGQLGVGKTRLAREAAAASCDDVAVEWISATAMASQIPFGVLAHLIERDLVGNADDRLRVARGIRAELQSRAAGRPLVVAVDDAQWLDAGAAALVHQLVTTGEAKLLLTLRTDEPTPEPIVACWKDGWVERLEVQPLSAMDLADLVVSVVGGPVDRVSLQRLWALTEGNPLFLHELLRGALEAGAFRLRDGVWNWAAPVGPSGRLAQILESRLARVTPVARKLIDVLAVGEPLPADLLLDLHGMEALVEAERLGLTMIDERDDDLIRLSHPFYGEVLRAALGTIARRQVQVQLADAMGEVDEASPALRLRVALWRLESGTPVSADALAEAAAIANSMYDHRLAERLAREAEARGGGLQASLVLGDALNRQGRCTEALEVFEPLVGATQTEADHVAVAVGRYFALTTEHGFRLEFEEVVLDAERQVQDPGRQAFLHALRASLLSSAGRLEDGVNLARQAVEEHPDEVTELRAVSPFVSAWLVSGRADTACAMTERLLEPAIRLRAQVPQAPGWVMSLHLSGLVIAGRLDDADATTSFVETLVTSAGGAGDAAAFIALTRGMSCLQRGQVRTALAHLRESVAMLRPFARWRLPFPLVQLVEAAALAGDEDTAATASAEADELVRHHQVFEGVARRARGWAALARGDRSNAVRLFLAAADWSGSNGQHTAELLALHDALRLGELSSVVSRIQDVAARSEGRWAPVFAMHGRGLAESDADALVLVAEAFEGLGAMLLAAEASAHASKLFAGRGSRANAERAAARATALAANCEQAQSPALEDLRQPLPLTRREREVAALTAQGLTSQAVAERLFVSVRTVEGHLQNIYGKLGVTDRSGLARALGAR